MTIKNSFLKLCVKYPNNNRSVFVDRYDRYSVTVFQKTVSNRTNVLYQKQLEYNINYNDNSKLVVSKRTCKGC